MRVFSIIHIYIYIHMYTYSGGGTFNLQPPSQVHTRPAVMEGSGKVRLQHYSLNSYTEPFNHLPQHMFNLKPEPEDRSPNYEQTLDPQAL